MSPVHVRAEPRDFAKSVLLPRDPRRAKYMAESFFEEAKLVTEERGMLGYTGTCKGEPVSVQATGMGCPSAAIVTEVLVGERQVHALPGSFVFIPRGTVHAAKTIGTEPGKVLVAYIPGGQERVFEEVGRLPPEVMAEEYDSEFGGPPL